MKSFAAALISVFAILPYVAAHGSVTKVIIDGKEYDGPKVNDPSPSTFLYPCLSSHALSLATSQQPCSHDRRRIPRQGCN